MSYPTTLLPHANLSRRLAATATPRRQFGQSRGFRASGLSSCLRQVGYRALGHPGVEEFNADWSLAAEQGNTIHLDLQRHLVSADLCLHLPGHRVPRDLAALLPDAWHDASLEVPVARFCHPEHRAWIDRIGFSGTIDGVLRVADGSLAIVDIKSVQDKYIDPGYRYHAAKVAGYGTQVGAYMALFATPDGERARQAWVLMVSRDSTDRRLLYRIDYDADAWAADAARLEAAKAAVDAGDLPVAEPIRGCRFCSYKTRCEGYRP